MAAPAPYIAFGGDARSALEFYHSVFGGECFAHSFSDFGRTDGDAGWVAHGGVMSPDIVLFCSDTSDEIERGNGIQLTILGTDADKIRGWFDGLQQQARSVRPLAQQPWGDYDGDIVDRYGVRWLLGYAAPGGAATAG